MCKKRSTRLVSILFLPCWFQFNLRAFFHRNIPTELWVFSSHVHLNTVADEMCDQIRCSLKIVVRPFYRPVYCTHVMVPKIMRKIHRSSRAFETPCAVDVWLEFCPKLNPIFALFQSVDRNSNRTADRIQASQCVHSMMWTKNKRHPKSVSRSKTFGNPAEN